MRRPRGSTGAFRRPRRRLLWVGEAVSALGDQFALVALPWLALVITGSALALGSVLALMAVPRAALMLVGGVYVDRLTPRRVMILANAVRLVTVTVLAAAVLAGEIGMPMLYLFALVFGVAYAFFLGDGIGAGAAASFGTAEAAGAGDSTGTGTVGTGTAGATGSGSVSRGAVGEGAGGPRAGRWRGAQPRGDAQEAGGHSDAIVGGARSVRRTTQ